MRNIVASFLTSFFRFFIQILLMKKEIVPHELEFLLRFPAVMNVTSPVDFLNNLCWGGIKVCSLKSVHLSEVFALLQNNKYCVKQRRVIWIENFLCNTAQSWHFELLWLR